MNFLTASSSVSPPIHLDMPRLTIILPLKGRYLFTLRFLWHANRARLPYRIVIADGQVRPALAKILENSREHFANLDVTYLRYPDDIDYHSYFLKMTDALQRVKTPYAMLADNDDFIAREGIERSLNFLDVNKDYICCGGGLAGFSVYSGLRRPNGPIGRFNRYAYRYTHLDRSEDFSSSSPVERLCQGSRNWWSYYAIYRTEGLQTIWREILDIDFSDLHLHELFCAMRALTLGKIRSDAKTISYLRQYGTSLGYYKKGWVHHLLRSRFTQDFDAMIDRVSTAAAAVDGVQAAPIAEMLRLICDGWLHEFLEIYYGSLQSVKRVLRNNTPSFVNWLKNRRRYFVARERADIFARLANDGASVDYLTTLADELRMMEDVVAGREFAAFIEPYIPVLDAADSPPRSAPAQLESSPGRRWT
jgi:glycosyltransferase domain-containing protein